MLQGQGQNAKVEEGSSVHFTLTMPLTLLDIMP